MDRAEALLRIREARVGRLASVRPDGSPHVVPFVFALVEGRGSATVYWAVDDKPKRSERLQRLVNLEHEPRVEIVVDGYAEDWRALWWVRASGRGRVVDDDAERDLARASLAARYGAYARLPDDLLVVAIDLERISGWSASEDA